MKYCKSDALALKKTLIAGGFQENKIILMTDDAEELNLVPTKENIQNVLTQLESHVKEGDIVWERLPKSGSVFVQNDLKIAT